MTTNKVCGKGKCKFTDEFCMSGDCPYDTDNMLKNQQNFNMSEGKVKDDNINVANNVAQRNSQTLTEQWKKGKIKKGNYWVKYRSGKIDTWELSGGITIESKPEIIEVLAPVLSFEECNKLQNSLEHEKMRATHYYKTLIEIEDENEKLEELLKECWQEIKPLWDKALWDNPERMPYSDRFIRLDKLKTKIDEVLK